MIEEITIRLHTAPFAPFTIFTSDGRKYSIPHPDYAHVGPRGTRVVVFDDDDTSASLTPLHIAAIKDGPTRVRSRR